MKVLFIGDLHGLSDWKQVALDGMKTFCHIVFLGDYLDSFNIKPIDQLVNLKELITFIKTYPTQVTALLGNHDYAYLQGISGISGYQYTRSLDYMNLFQDNINFFKIAWGYTNPITQKYTLSTHAGLTHDFYINYIFPEIQEKIVKERYGDVPDFSREGFLYKINKESAKSLELHEILNFLRDKKDILWKVGSMRGGSGTPGPLWADYDEFIEDPYPGINQVFGHTPRPAITISHNDGDFYACVDNWGNKKVSSLIVTL